MAMLYVCSDYNFLLCYVFGILQSCDEQALYKVLCIPYSWKFGGEFNLAVWRLARTPPNLIPTKFYIRQNFVG